MQGIEGRSSPGTQRGVEGREGTQGPLGGRSRSWMGAGGLGPGGGSTRHGAQPEGGRGWGGRLESTWAGNKEVWLAGGRSAARPGPGSMR